jgi:hypothetical protein
MGLEAEGRRGSHSALDASTHIWVSPETAVFDLSAHYATLTPVPHSAACPSAFPTSSGTPPGRLNGVDVDDKVLQEVIAALKSKALVGGAQKSLLDVMPKTHDFTMHANWSRIQDADVRSVLGFIEQFLLTTFG